MSYDVYLKVSYYSTFVILLTAFILMAILASFITYIRKKYTIDAIDSDALDFDSFDIRNLTQSVHRLRRLHNPE